MGGLNTCPQFVARPGSHAAVSVNPVLPLNQAVSLYCQLRVSSISAIIHQ